MSLANCSNRWSCSRPKAAHCPTSAFPPRAPCRAHRLTSPQRCQTESVAFQTTTLARSIILSFSVSYSLSSAKRSYSRTPSEHPILILAAVACDPTRPGPIDTPLAMQSKQLLRARAVALQSNPQRATRRTRRILYRQVELLALQHPTLNCQRHYPPCHSRVSVCRAAHFV